MSFQFEWPTFSEGFYSDAREMLEQALNKGTKPPIIADRIEVKELNMGTVPPELEILEIGDLSTDRFRGIFRLTYAGDAFIVLQTKVQANPLNVPRPTLDILGSPRILFAAAPLIVPMTLRLSSLSLRAIVVLVVSRQKGITLVFKNDPLESVNVSSSFDGVESVAGYIQKEIEGQLREAFRSDLPGVIHRLSQKWLSGEVKSASSGTGVGVGGAKGGKAFEKNAKIETRTEYPTKEGKKGGRGLTTNLDSMSIAGESVSIASSAEDSMYASSIRTSPSFGRMGRRMGSGSTPGTSPTSTNSSRYKDRMDDALQSVPESIESYDPTYGLRPDSIPLHAGFGDYERLVRTNQTGKGLGDALGSSSDEEDDSFEHDDPSFDMIGLIDLVDDGSGVKVPSWEGRGDFGGRYSFESRDEGVASGYETIPAVGGGTITRPRIFHTQSQMRTRSASSGSLSAHGSPSTSSMTAKGGSVAGSSASTLGGFARPPPMGMSLLEKRSSWQAGGPGGFMSASGTSTPRFGFGGLGSPSGPPSMYGSAPSIVRNTYSPMPMGVRHRSALSASSSLKGFQSSNLASSYSSPPPYSPPASAAPPIPSPEDEDPPFPPPRRDPIDLLSRSPSSVLNNSIDDDLPITLNPSRSDSCAHLATLTSSNQTLSPFTRNHEHFTARSSPHVFTRLHSGSGRGQSPSAVRAGLSGLDTTNAPVKAVRKRIHRFGSAKLSTSTTTSGTATPTGTGTQTPSLKLANNFGGSVRGSTAPSEMSDYFPSLGAAVKANLRQLPLRREMLNADRY